WRGDPQNRLLVVMITSVIGAAGLTFIGRRLWKSRRQVEIPVSAALKPTGRRTALHELEKDARRILGQRPAGKTYAAWLAGLRTAIPVTGLLDEALALHQRLRFDPQPAEPTASERLAALATELRAAMTQARRSR